MRRRAVASRRQVQSTGQVGSAGIANAGGSPHTTSWFGPAIGQRRRVRGIQQLSLFCVGAWIGLSVLVWQHIMGVDLYWVILPLAVILLLAVGSDYNLLLVSRFKEEIHAGINTGIIRSMAGSGSVVTAAGLVFVFTMASFIFSQPAGARPDPE